MTPIGIGVGIRLSIPRTLREQTRALYTGLLGATLKESQQSDRDYFRFPNGTRIAAFYVEPSDALTPAQLKSGAWIELEVDNLPATLSGLERLGIRPFEYPIDVEHKYVQAPGGQVFRLLEEKPLHKQ